MPEFNPPEPEIGKEFGVEALGSIFKYIEFPIDKQELIRTYGEREIEYSTGETMKVKDILAHTKRNVIYSLEDLEQAFHERLREE